MLVFFCKGKTTTMTSVNTSSRRTEGVTLLELLTVLAVVGVVAGAIFYNFRRTANPPRDVTQVLQAKMSLVRTDSMANTLANRILLVNDDLIIQQSLSCNASTWRTTETIQFDPSIRRDVVLITTPSATGTPDPSLPPLAKLVVCFSPRGTAVVPRGQSIASLNASYRSNSYTLQVALGGGVRVVTN